MPISVRSVLLIVQERRKKYYENIEKSKINKKKYNKTKKNSKIALGYNLSTIYI